MNVRRIRKAKGLTVTALADKSGISRQTLHKIENGGGNIKVSKIYELSEALDVTPAHILEDPEKLPINDIAKEWRRKQRELEQAQSDK